MAPPATGSGESVIATERSAAEETAIADVPVALFAVVGSNSFAATVALFVIEPTVPASTVIVTTAL